jgi:hypothetical protein
VLLASCSCSYILGLTCAVECQYTRIVNWIGGLQTPRRLSKTRFSLFVVLINLFSLSL